MEKTKIPTERNWQLELVEERHHSLEVDDTLDLRELHDDRHPDDHIPHVVIPIESVDALVLSLLQYKKRYFEKMEIEIYYNNDWMDE